MDCRATESEERTMAAEQADPVALRRRRFLKEHGQYLISILGSILITAAILLAPLVLPIDYAQLGDFGYLGVFLTTLLSSATIVIPSPTLAAAYIGGGFLFPPLVGLLAGVGATLGEMSGYMAGYGGSVLAARSRYYEPVRRFVERYGLLAIFFFALIPNPLFDLAGIAAGTTRIPVWAFLAACGLGKTVRFIGIAYLGRWLGADLLSRVGRFLWLQIGNFL
jgi:membrane protein YqaA with SNARE-associated domain